MERDNFNRTRIVGRNVPNTWRNTRLERLRVHHFITVYGRELINAVRTNMDCRELRNFADLQIPLNSPSAIFFVPFV
jgi:hypothetical protein